MTLDRYTLINCRKQFPNTSLRLLKDILCFCLRERAITGGLWEGVYVVVAVVVMMLMMMMMLPAFPPPTSPPHLPHSSFALLVTLQQPELCLPLLHAMQVMLATVIHASFPFFFFFFPSHPPPPPNAAR